MSSGDSRRSSARPSQRNKTPVRKSAPKNRKGRKRKSARRRKKRLLLAALLAILVLAGFGIFRAVKAVNRALGPEDYDSSTAEFRKDGSIRMTSVETFDQSWYDADELSQEIQNAVDSYNESKGADRVTEESFSVTDGSAKVVLIYETSGDYEDFNNATLFTGTVQEAEDEGFDFESIMQAVSNADSSRILTQATLEQLLSNQAIILTEQVNVVLPKKEKFLYATPNLGVTDFQHATAIDTISDEKPAIIILQ